MLSHKNKIISILQKYFSSKKTLQVELIKEIQNTICAKIVKIFPTSFFPFLVIFQKSHIFKYNLFVF